MEDIIDIIVTETTNLIEITSQPTDEIIDVNIIDNREDVTLNVTPSVVEININSLTGNFGVTWGEITGTLSSQTDLQTVLNAKADLVDGKVPSSQLPSYVDDVVEVANYASLPVTGEVGKIYITLDTNFIYRWSGSTYIEIKDSSAVWGAITGTLSSQTDLQSALNAKVPYTGATGNVNLGEYGATVGYLGFDTTPSGTPTGIGTMYWDSANRTVSLIDGDGDTTLQIGQEERVLVHNNTGSTLTDGQVVYVTGSTGELPSVALASNTTEATSSVTFGIVTESIANGADGFVTTSGIVHGLNTNAFTEGAAIWLGSTAGTFTETKPVAPANSVLVGYVIKKAGGNGSIFVKIQNGYELEELHDVLITSVANNQGLFYDSATSLWKNKSIATVLGYTPEQPLTFSSPLVRSTNAVSIPAATSSVNGYLSSADWTTFNAKISGSGATGYYARFTSSGVISDGFIQTTSNITYVEGMGLSTGNGLDIEGAYGGGSGGLKIRSYDETTGNAYIDFANTGGRMYLGLNRSTSGGLMTNATAYATVLTTGLGTTNLEFGTNATKRLTIDGTTGALSASTSSGQSLTLDSTDTTLNQILLNRSGTTLGKVYLYYDTVNSRPEMVIGTYGTGGRVRIESGNNTTALTIDSSQNAQLVGNLQIGSSSSLSKLTIGTGSGYTGIILNNSSSVYSWLLGSQYNVNNAFEITPSTTVGGSTFANPVFKITNTGNATFSSTDLNTIFVINSTTTGATTGSGIGFQAYNGTSVTQSAGIFLTSNTWSYGTYSANQLSIGAEGTGGLALRSANSAPIAFFTGGTSAGVSTERMRITSGGAFYINQTANDAASGGAFFQLTQGNGNWIHQIRNSNTSGGVYGSNIVFSQAPNNTFSAFFAGGDSSAERYRMYANGGLANYQANNVNLSDERTKKEITPLESYWNKFKALEIVKFKYKDQTHDDFNIGVIAQQVESVAPEFVDLDGWGQPSEDETPLKSIYTADLYHASIGVLKEAMAKIETLEAKIKTLENK